MQLYSPAIASISLNDAEQKLKQTDNYFVL